MRSETVDHGPTLDAVIDASTIRSQHRRLMLQLLWKERETSRADLARRTGLSRSTVSAIVQDLLETGLVHEVRTGVSTGGRRPIVLAFDDEAAYLVGVELGASHVTAVLTDLRGRVLDGDEVPCPVRDDPAEALDVVRRMVKPLLERRRGIARRTVGVGVAVPSPLDPERPGHMVSSIVPRWDGIDVGARLRSVFRRPIMLDNDANLGALAELWWGAGTDDGSLAYLKVATGIGAGLIFAGRIFRGAGGIAGEIGHTSIDPKGPVCMCGLRGCLTTLVGTQYLFERVRSLRRRYRKSRLQDEPLTVGVLVDAALAGDRLAVRVVEEAGRTLGIAVANLMNLMNPARVVVGGALTRVGDLLLDPLRDTVSNRALAESIAHADIVRSPLGEHGIAVGAATLVLETALANPTLFPPPRGVARA